MSSSDAVSVHSLLAQARAAHAAAGETLSKLEGLLAADAKKAAKKAAKAEAKTKAEGSEGSEAAPRPRGVWVAWVYGDAKPSDGGEAIIGTKERYSPEYASYKKTLSSQRGADINFGSLASEAALGDPIGVPKPKQGEEGHEEEGESAFAERLEAWRNEAHPVLVAHNESMAEPLPTHWTVDAAAEYAEHEARYKAMASARSADGSSTKSKRPKFTEEEILERREARKADTAERNRLKKLASDAEKEAAKAAKAKAKPTPKATVKNAAAPPPAKASTKTSAAPAAKAGTKAAVTPAKAAAPPTKAPVAPTKAPKAPAPKSPPKASMASLTAADSDSDSDSDSDEEPVVVVKAPPKAKAKAKAKAAPPPPPVDEEDVGLTLTEVKGHGSVLKTEDNYLFASTAEAGEPGAYIGLLLSDGSVDTKAMNPFKHAEDA